MWVVLREITNRWWSTLGLASMGRLAPQGGKGTKEKDLTRMWDEPRVVGQSCWTGAVCSLLWEEVSHWLTQKDRKRCSTPLFPPSHSLLLPPMVGSNQTEENQEALLQHCSATSLLARGSIWKGWEWLSKGTCNPTQSALHFEMSKATYLRQLYTIYKRMWAYWLYFFSQLWPAGSWGEFMKNDGEHSIWQANQHLQCYRKFLNLKACYLCMRSSNFINGFWIT